MKKKNKEIPVLSNKIVPLVLDGYDNIKIIKKLGLKGSKNYINGKINNPRKWFKSHEREKKYAVELLSVFNAEDIIIRFDYFCSRPKDEQAVMKDTLLAEKIEKIKKAKVSGGRPLALAQ